MSVNDENLALNSAELARRPAVRRLIELALDEDLGRGDVTTEAVVGSGDVELRAAIVARTPLVVFGLGVAAKVFSLVDPQIATRAHHADGARAEAGARVMSITGPAASVLKAERTALNFLQRLSGVATLARRYADEAAGRCRIVDTRKTTPGFRALEKAAVAAGGCHNHRSDLGSGILIKDNHIAACGSVTAAVKRALERAPHGLRVEVEVDTLEQLDEALDAGADAVLLDNMSPDEVRVAADRARARTVFVEVSGGVTLERVAAYAEAGADAISIGALTHSAPAVDLALDIV
jgi:nicotinate-nucleotide pyrophosphorylase (carboxylating)